MDSLIFYFAPDHPPSFSGGFLVKVPVGRNKVPSYRAPVIFWGDSGLRFHIFATQVLLFMLYWSYYVTSCLGFEYGCLLGW